MLKGFRDFVLRGNVVDLAVAVVIGAAFTKIVTALVGDFISPLIAAIVKQPDFSKFEFIFHGGHFKYGDFINNIINFLIVAFAMYFFVVLPVNSLMKRFHKAPAPAPTTRPCPECLSDIPIAATRCSHCAQPVSPAAAA
jgi:large conductance mechanosensitive channel